MQRAAKKRTLAMRRRRANDIFHQHRILPDAFYLIPRNDYIRFPAEQPEKAGAPKDDKRADTGAAGIKLHIAHTPQASAVLDIHYLLTAQIHHAANHLLHHLLHIPLVYCMRQGYSGLQQKG